MPYAVVHMLVPMILIDILRHNVLKIRDKLPNRYILIAGLAGLLPDIDILFSFLFPGFIFHRGITHTVWVPLALLLIFMILRSIKKHNSAKIFLMCSIGIASHIILDFVTAGSMKLLYPLTNASFAVNLIPTLLPNIEVSFFYATLDAILLFVWLARMILRRRIQDIF